MSKKRKAEYSKEALKVLSAELKKVRCPVVEGASLLEVKVDDINLFGEAVKRLPKKEKEALEKFFGLIEGTVPFRKDLKKPVHNRSNTQKFDVAYWNMASTTYEAMRDLLSLDMMYVYNSHFKELVSNIVAKMDRTEVEEMSDLDAVKYLLLFYVFIMRGRLMMYEEEARELDWQREEIGNYDFYTLLEATWQSSICHMPEGNINMGLLRNIVDMFDIQDIISMKRYVGLPIKISEWSISYTVLESFKDIRQFKERLFNKGEWLTTSLLIYNQGANPINLKPFGNAITSLRYGKVEKFLRKANPTDEGTSSPEENSDMYYQIGSMKFTDPYEMMSLYACRRMLK